MGTLKQMPITCSGHTRPVVDLKYSDITSSSYYLISACKDGKPMLREGDTGDWIGTFEGHKGAVWGATLTKDSLRAATAAADFTAKIWDSLSGTELHSLPHKHIVKCVDFSNDNSKLITGCNDKIVRLFDLNDYSSEPLTFSGHTSNIKKAIFSHDSSRIISISDDKTLRIWDINSQTEVQSLQFNNSPNSIELSSDGEMFVLTHGKFVEFYNTKDLSKLYTFTMPCTINTATINPDKTVFVCAGDDFILYKYSIQSGIELESFKGHFGPVHCVQFSPDGEVYASGSEDGTLRLWQTTIGKTYGLWKCESNETNTEETTTTTTSSSVPIVAN